MSLSRSVTSHIHQMTSSSSSSFPKRMRSIVFGKYGSRLVDNDLRLDPSRSVPVCGVDQVVIDVRSSSINPFDLKVMRGFFPVFIKFPFPMIPGTDASGVISQIGSGVQQWKVGQEVMVQSPVAAALAEQLVVPANVVVAKPKTLDFIQASAVPNAGKAAFLCLTRHLAVKSGQRVLILGGSGGVGTFGISIARALGCHVLTTASPAGTALVQRLGAEQVIDYTTQDFSDPAIIPSNSIDAVLDTVGGYPNWVKSQRVLKNSGSYVTLTGDHERVITVGELLRTAGGLIGRKLYGFASGAPSYNRFFNKIDPVSLAALGDFIDTHRIVPVVEKVYPGLERAPEAFQRLSEGRTKGKLVVEVRPS